MPKAQKLIAVCGFILFCVFALWSIFGVPMNMDEVLPYHALACASHPMSSWHVFREGCDGHYHLITPVGFVYERAYAYVGGLSSLLYSPFYDLAPSITTQYVYGLILFVLFALILSRLTSRPWLSFPLFLSFFPALFQFIHDTGPIKFSAILFVLTPIIFSYALRQSRMQQIAWGVILAVLFTLATEEKIFFVYLVLPLALFSLAELQRRTEEAHPFITFFQYIRKKPVPALLCALGRDVRCGWNFILPLAILSIIGIGMLFLSKTPDGQHYISYVKSVSPHQRITHMLNDFRLYTLYWPSFAHRVYDLDQLPAKWILQLLTLAFLASCIYVFRKTSYPPACSRLRTRLLVYSTLSLAALFLLTRTVWAGHHYIFLWIPLLVLFAELVAHVKTKTAVQLVGAYFILNLASVLVLASASPITSTAWERDKIFAYFNNPDVADHAIINPSIWGTYYILALYAPRDALVTYIDPLSPDDAAKLYDISLKTNRQIYDICYGDDCTVDKLDQVFGQKLHFQEVSLGLKEWRVFVGQ